MSIVEVLYKVEDQHPYDLLGILKVEDKLCGLIDNRPLRRKPVPYETISLYKGNDRRLRIYIKDEDLNVIDLTGSTALLTVKGSKTDTSPLFTKSTAVPAEGMIGSADEGELFFMLVPADTSGLDAPSQYVYDVSVTVSGGETYTVLEGYFDLRETVA